MHRSPNELSRRDLLATGAGGAISGILASAQGLAAAPPSAKDVYRQLGVRPLINAAGTITALGGSLMPPEVLAAWHAAAGHFVPLLELQDRVGQRIAELLNVEAALVTTGAAGGIVVATAAALTYRDPGLIEKLPLSSDDAKEVIRQKSHRDCYDHQVRACGVRLVDVETRDELQGAISDRTAMMFSYNFREAESSIPQEDWIAVARQHQIPTLLDAAADTPPPEALWKYNQMGFDMVVFSGGKALRGPQNAGLLLGRRDLVEAAKLNTAPRCGNIGRGMKVSKEDMVAMWAAVERYVRLDHEAERNEWLQRIEVIEQAVRNIPTATTKRIVPPIANQVPHVLISWDEEKLRITPDQLKQRLAAGDPPIATARVHGTGTDGFLISVFMLQDGEAQIVARRLQEILRA